jgi:outer membrane protein
MSVDKPFGVRPATNRRGRGSARRALAGVAALVLFALPLAADTQVAREVTEIGPLSGLTFKEGVVQLSLDDAIHLALARNLGLVVERHRLSESEYGILQARGIYDFTATTDALRFSDENPAASNLTGAEVENIKQTSLNLGLQRLIPTGGNFDIAWNNRRRESNSQFQTVNPEYRIDFDLTFSQPLLRNRGKAATERNLRIARINRDISQENFELQVTGTIQQVVDAYWTLVEAREQYDVARESLKLAQELHEQNRVRVDVGTLAPLELIQSEAGIATREEQVIRAKGAIGDAEDRLRQLLNMPTDEHWDTPFVPTSSPESAPVEIDLQSSLTAALANRPELRSKRLSQNNLEQDVDYFRHQRLPRLDASVTYGFNGLGGPVTEREFPSGDIISTSPGGYSDALDQVTGQNFIGWSASLNLIYPIENRVAKAQSALAEVTRDRSKVELKDLELAVVTEVRRLARFVETAQQALASAQVSKRLAQKNLEAEQKRYDNGMSTSFQVLQIQEDLTEARQREVNAVTGLRKAVALFYQSTGDLIEESGVEIVGGEDASEPMADSMAEPMADGAAG